MQDPKIEALLIEEAIPFTRVIGYPLNKINETLCKTRQTRPEQVVKDAIATYTARYKQGVDMNAIVVHETSKGTEILDGFQRYNAAMGAKLTTIDAYVVCTDNDGQLKFLSYMINQLGGLTVDLAYIFPNILADITSGMSVAAVARRWRIPYEKVANAVRVSTFNIKAENLGINVPPNISSDTRDILAGYDPSVLEKLIPHIIEYNYSSRDIKSLSSALKDKHSNTDRLAYIAKEEKRPDMQNRRRGAVAKPGKDSIPPLRKTNTPAAQVIQNMTKITRILDRCSSYSAAKFTNIDEYDALVEQANKVANKLSALYLKKEKVIDATKNGTSTSNTTKKAA